MGIGKARASLGQPIDVGRLHHRMPVEVADPIILIINGDVRTGQSLKSARASMGNIVQNHAHLQSAVAPQNARIPPNFITYLESL